MLASRLSTRSDVLRALFAHMGAHYTGVLAKDAATAMELWFNEHGELNVEYPEKLLIASLPYGEQLGLIGPRIDLPTQMDVRRMNNPGGTIAAMVKRFKLDHDLPALGYRIGEMLTWAGQRTRYPDRKETLPEIIAFIKLHNAAVLNDPWVVQQLALDDEDPNPFKRPFATEVEICILCAKLVWGDKLVLSQVRHISEPTHVFDLPTGRLEVPGREVLYYRFTRPGCADLIIFNGAAVERRGEGGKVLDVRPTTASTAAEIAGVFGFGGTEGLMVSKPHTARLAAEIDDVVAGLGHNVAFAVFSLPTPVPDNQAELVRLARTMLGEIARSLKNEAHSPR